ncbi:MAG: DUF2190 family protein [Anaerolineae bacterium]|nr:DUF2190 family protein [Anaerolineae bacterium]
MTGLDTHKESDGKSVTVTLTHTIQANAIVYAQGFLGISGRSGDSGDSVAVSIDRQEYQFTVPSGLSVSKGDIVRLDTTAITNTHIPPDGAYNKNALSATNINLFKATSDKDANHVVTGILLSGL